MSTPFQNRLVGTIIVAAAAVIFLPDILDGEKKEYQADFEGIPDSPSLVIKQATKEFPQDKLEATQKVSTSKEMAVEQAKKKSQPEPIEPLKVEAEKAVPVDNSKVKVKAIQKADSFTSNSVPSANVTPPETIQSTQQWVIQLGSFRHLQNVQDLVNKLDDAGYKVFTKPIKTKSGSLTKVFVGPELAKATLEKELTKLKQLTKVQGKLARYTVKN